MKIAITGPDGSGKTSLSSRVNTIFPGSIIIYAGKKQGHFLRITTYAYRFWQWAKQRKIPLFATMARFFLFYPIEFFENRARFSLSADFKKLVIYDRHPIDRMIMPAEFKKNRAHGVNPYGYLFEYQLLRFYRQLYMKFFPVIDHVIILLPEAELCFKRANGFYKSIMAAHNKVSAYRALSEQYKFKQPLTVIEITPSLTIDDVCNQVVQIILSVRDESMDN